MQETPATLEARPGPHSTGAGLPTPALPPFRKRRRVMPLFVGILLVAAVAASVFYYLRWVAPFESTDDAFIEGNVTFISPRVSGPVVRLLVKDNQLVKEGELLLEIDPQDYQTKVSQAQADLAVARSQLEAARAQVTVDEARLAQAEAAVTAAQAEARRSAADQKRFESVESRAVSRSQLDLAQTQARSSAATVEITQSEVRAAEAQVNLSQVKTQTAAAAVGQAEAKLHQAELDLSYTKVTAPKEGHVTRRTVEQGAFVQTGQALLALVPEPVWVVANFKETQLEEMRPGQAVTIRVDGQPRLKLSGHVDSLQYGTGARFSLLPPENAVGNYVKVVQRVPVKIILDAPLPPGLDISPGMSVVPEVRVKPATGEH